MKQVSLYVIGVYYDIPSTVDEEQVGRRQKY